jgi:hypothetical protein
MKPIFSMATLTSNLLSLDGIKVMDLAFLYWFLHKTLKNFTEEVEQMMDILFMDLFWQ